MGQTALWLCRTGSYPELYEKLFSEKKLYLCWEGFNEDLQAHMVAGTVKKLIVSEKKTLNQTSIANWAGQIRYFCQDMQIGDLVLIPYLKSSFFTLAMITSDYIYDSSEIKSLHHSRYVKIIHSDIPREIFTQRQVYRLGAYRTVFRVGEAESILNTIRQRFETL